MHAPAPPEAEIEAEALAALDRSDHRAAAAAVIRGYGPKVLGYLAQVLPVDADAADAFSLWAEQVWRGISSFERRSAVKTWAFKAGWSAAMRVRDDAWRRLGRRLETGEASRLADDVRTHTVVRREAQAAHLEKLRAELSPEDQTLLVLRLDQRMSWEGVADVLSQERAVEPAALRKRYERIKARLAQLVRTELPEDLPSSPRRKPSS